jgi:hypothetical protein
MIDKGSELCDICTQPDVLGAPLHGGVPRLCDLSQTTSASLEVTGGRIGGIFGPRIEGDRCFWRRVVNDVHDCLK